MEKEHYTLHFPSKANKTYDIALMELYLPRLTGLAQLANVGIGGMCLQEDKYMGTQEIFDILRQQISLPEHHHNQSMPQITEGGRIETIIDMDLINEGRGNKTTVILRNTYSELFNKPDEGEAMYESAVAVVHTLYANKWLPYKELFKGRYPMMITSVSINPAGPTDMFVEVELVCKNRCKADFDIPMDSDYIPKIDVVEDMING